MKAVVLLVIVLAITGAFAIGEDKRPKKKRGAFKLRDLCAKGSREVAGGQCCPKDHPILIGDSCFAHCEDGNDDMQLGSSVGCRAQCEPGSSSTLTTCYRGPLHTERADHSRTGVTPGVQIKLNPTVSALELDGKYLARFCPDDYITVARRKDKSGGCCPKDAPLWIAGKCYSHCEQGFDDIVIGQFVGCRKQCPDGWEQTTNTCHKSGEEDTERGDFPREGMNARNRRRRGRAPEPKNPKVNCPPGTVSVVNSESLCCPWDHAELVGALCYEECPASYVSAGFGCRRACPRKAGWITYPLTCTKWNHKPAAKTILRKGWERAPVTPKQALTPTPGQAAAAAAATSEK